ncbi:MAG: MoaD/ThiS family protein [Promethearchaeota archaeon]|nr:MAG: MoaD/ThiS family protein [Candidatus Lokiarchaeota archaeon]
MTKNNSISVTVKLFADLRIYGPDRTVLALQEGSTIKSILKRYKIPKDDKNLIIMVNGRPHIQSDFVLGDGDTVAIFPIIAGG